MSGYTVENMSFGPVDSSDLERLLGTGDGSMSSMMGGDMRLGQGQGGHGCQGSVSGQGQSGMSV